MSSTNGEKKNDYPRIIAFLKLKLPSFEEWMQDQNITDDILIEFSPSKLIQEVDKVYIYHLSKQDVLKKVVHEKKYEKGESFYHGFIIQNKVEIIPYLSWYSSRKGGTQLHIAGHMWVDRKMYFMKELELLNLGYLCLDSNFRQNTKMNDGINEMIYNLDFVNLDGLQINNFITGYVFRIWFSSANNISINGDFHSLNAYYSYFGNSYPSTYNLKLINGSFQRWTVKDCRFDLSAKNSNLMCWTVRGLDFKITISNVDIANCEFEISKIKYNQELGRAKEFCALIKRLYSQLGKRKEAGKYFYLEKQYERKSYWFPKENFKEEFYNYKNKHIFNLRLFYFKYRFKYFISGFLNILWGYGEKPERVFYISLSVISICTILNFFVTASSTCENFIDSFYYSIVTFTTLGYGDIKQENDLLKILSAFEALAGMSFWGILIAGFTNNSRDY